MPETVLYQFGGKGSLPSFSPPCLKIWLALRRMGLPHRVVDVSSPMAVKRHSPTGRLPAIVVDGTTISDSVHILDELARRHPDASLWPKDARERTVDRLWDTFGTDTLYWQGFYLRWVVPENRKRVTDAALGPGFSIRKLVVATYGGIVLGRRARGQGIGGRSKEDVEASYRLSLAMIEDGLGDGPFLQSRKEPGRGDLSIASHFAQFALSREDPGVARLMAAKPRVFAHCAATFEACGAPLP